MAFLGESGDLFTFWKSDTGIVALVGAGPAAKIYDDWAKQGVSPPYVVCLSEQGQSFRHHKGISVLRETVLHVYCFGQTGVQAAQLAEAIKGATEPLQETTIGSTWIGVVTATAPDGGGGGAFDAPVDGSAAYKFWRRIVFRIVHSQ